MATYEEVRKYRFNAEKAAAGSEDGSPAQTNLALFIIAEQLYLLREALDSVIDGEHTISTTQR